MEAPEKCNPCPVAANVGLCCHSISRDGLSSNYVPGPSCPFVLLAAKDAELEKMRELLDKSTTRMETLLENQSDCGDPDCECPLQDAHKDYHIAGQIKRNRAALKGVE